MWNIFNKDKTKEDVTSEVEKEFVFIWYKEMKLNNNETHYIKPYRTVVKAKTFEEAKEKVTDFAIGKMKLIIMEEKEYSKSNLKTLDDSLKSSFDHINRIMSEFFLDTRTK